jgi:hypothetical protein
MLAMADRHGRVWASIPGLAKEAAVSVEACRTAIDEFLGPDPDSRTKANEGRRIEPIDGGWRLINHAKYRAIRDQEERRAYKAEKQREYRSVDKVDKSGHRGPKVERGAHNAEAEADTEAEEQILLPSPVFRLPATGGKSYGVTQDQITHWKELYPGVDVIQQLRAMIGWLEANSTKRKTAGGMARFINSWLAKEQNRGPQLIQNGGNHVGSGENRPSPAKQRIDGARRVLAEIAVERGLIDTSRFDGSSDAPLSESGSGGKRG